MSIEIDTSHADYYNNAAYHAAENQPAEIMKAEKTAGRKDKVQEYYEKLCKKFPDIAFNTKGGELRCSANCVVVNLSYECLKKMANDPKFAKEIEWNLSGEVAANSQVYSFAKRDGVELGGRTVTYDANGNRQSSSGGMRTANANGGNGQKIQRKQQSWKDRLRKKRATICG